MDAFSSSLLGQFLAAVLSVMQAHPYATFVVFFLVFLLFILSKAVAGGGESSYRR